MHAGIYRLRPECGFIIHTHQANASAVSVLGEDIDLMSLSGRVFCKEEEQQILEELKEIKEQEKEEEYGYHNYRSSGM